MHSMLSWSDMTENNEHAVAQNRGHWVALQKATGARPAQGALASSPHPTLNYQACGWNGPGDSQTEIRD